jgi:hypothetical protein
MGIAANVDLAKRKTMNTTKQHLNQSFKTCVAKGCSNLGIYEMEIVFLGRKGWFCEQCKDSLINDGLLLQQQSLQYEKE